jgi:hypothetical protein
LGACAPGVAFIIADPADGPGVHRDPNYVAAIEAVRGSGISVLGYITMSYGRRRHVDLTDDLARWYALYAIDGIFLDEAPTDARHISASTRLYRLIKQRGQSAALVVLNPGTHTLEPYMDACDVLVTTESPWAAYRDAYAEGPGWTHAYPADRFWHIVYDCGTVSEMRQALWLARLRNAGWVYVTDRTGVNPYDGLPTRYWRSELKCARRPGDPRKLPGRSTGNVIDTGPSNAKRP